MPETHTELSGRALDAAIAVEVMGYRWYVGEYIGPSEGSATRMFFLSPEGVKRFRDGGDWRMAESPDYRDAVPVVPEFSSSWSAVQMVVEKMREKGWNFQVFGPETGNEKWRGKFEFHVHPLSAHQERRVVGVADTFPIAVCRAALAAVRGGKS